MSEKEYGIRELKTEEITHFLPLYRTDSGEDPISFGAVDSKDRVLCTAVFLRSSYRKDEAVLCAWSADPKADRKLQDKFFRSIVFILKKKYGFHSIYYRSTGTEEEIIRRYDLLVGLGFTPTVFLGHRIRIDAEELSQSGFVDAYGTGADSEEGLIPLSEISEPADLSFLMKERKHVRSLAKQIYSPEYSFLCRMDEEHAGILCASRSDRFLTVTDVFLRFRDTKKGLMIFYRLVGKLSSAVSKTMPADAQIVFSFDNPVCQEAIRRKFADRDEMFQEFLYQI